jgi:hypothetical protein
MHRVELECLSCHLSVLEEVQGDGSSLFAGRRRARNEGVDQVIELLGSESREELKLSTESWLVD